MSLSPPLLDEVAFGVGSFHFALAKNLPGGFSERKYGEAVVQALTRIPGIVEVDMPVDDLNAELEIGTFAGLRNGAPTYMPHIEGLQFSFAVQIPVPRLMELAPGIHPAPEPFRVIMVYPDEELAPFSLVLQPFDASEEPQTHDGLWAVMEYLEDEFGKLRHDALKFERQVETFPATFIVSHKLHRPARSQRVSVEDLGGWALVRFHSVSLDNVIEELESPMGLFFEAIQTRWMLRALEHEASSSLYRLTETHLTTGLRGTLRRILAHQRDLDRAYVLLVRHDAALIQHQHRLTKDLDETLTRSSLRPLRKLIEQAFPSSERKRTEVRELFSLLDRRTSARVGNRFVLVSTLMGVIVGALVTRLFAS